MRFLAAYIMRGQLPAITAITVCSVLALIAMPLSWPVGYLSAAGVALVTLVHGPTEGGKTLLGATVLLAVIGMLIMGSPTLALTFVMSLWLPAWILASIMLISRSLVMPMQVLLVLGLLAVVAMFAGMGDPALWWYEHIVNEVIPTLQKANMDIQTGPEFEQRLVEATKLLTGVLVMVMAWGVVAGLLIARWWQAVLYRPGAFGEEFRALRLGKIVALGAVLLALLVLVGDGLLADMARNMVLVMVGLLLLQGLAIVHALIASFKANDVWLVLMYMLLIFLMPYMLVMVTMTGLIDNWVDFRQRFQARA